MIHFFGKKFYKVFVLVLCFSFILFIPSCDKKSEELKDGEIYLYYTDKDKTELQKEKYKIENTDTEDVVDEVIKKMCETSNNLNEVTAKPDYVEINSYSITDTNTVNVDFNIAYNEMGKVEELLCRAAFVLTLTQIDNIEYVTFTINDMPLMYIDNTKESVGPMKAEDFVDICKASNSVNFVNKYEMKIYYLNKDMTGLVAVDCTKLNNKSASVEKMIIEKLIQGPDKNSGYVRTLPEDAKLLSVMTKDGICYVNFAKGFLDGKVDCSPELEVYSIVNSLCELSYVNKVSISVAGETDVTLRDEVSFKYEFSRNLDYME